MNYVMFKDDGVRFIYIQKSQALNVKKLLNDYFSEEIKTHIVLLKSCDITSDLVRFISLVEAIVLSDFILETETTEQSYYFANLGFNNICRARKMEQEHKTRYDESEVRKLIQRKYGFDLSKYNDEYISRTIKRFNHKFNIEDKQMSELLNERNMINNFVSCLSTGVTKFFRDVEYYKYLFEDVFSYLETFPSIRIWSAGSSTGEEAYSLAMMLAEKGLLDRTFIYATDYNLNSLRTGSIGYYSCNDVFHASSMFHDVCGGDISNYIEPHGKAIRITERLRDRVQFFQHDLINDNAFNTFHLVLCRNVLIYIKPESKNDIVDTLLSSTEEGCYMMFGKEEIIDYKYLMKDSRKLNIYRVWKER